MRTLAILLLLCAQAYAQTDDPQYLRATNNLAHEHIECATYYTLVRVCIGDRDKALAEQYAKVTTAYLERAFILTKEAKLKEETIKARMDMAHSEMTKSIDSHCSNISILLAKHADSCKRLIENPTQRAKELIDAEYKKR